MSNNITICTTKTQTILPDPYIKIDVFERKADYLLNTHTHKSFYHLNYIVEGEIELIINDSNMKIYKNQFFVIPPNTPHKIIAENGYRQIGMDIADKNDKRNLKQMIDSVFGKPVKTVRVKPPVIGFEEYTELLKNPLPLNIANAIHIYERVILDAIGIAAGSQNTISKQLTEIINANNPFTLTLSDICRITNYSKTQIERMANKELGCGVNAYLNNIKINEICTLLQSTDLSMSEISQRVGLYDASHLNTFFKRHMGQTPGTFRRDFRNTF